MSYAVIVTGGKQFRVSPGSVVRVPTMEAKVGEAIEFDQVLAVNNDAEIKVGAPLVAGAIVKATVLEHGRGKKIIVFKFKRRKQYKRKKGHRQGYTAIRIESVV